VLFCHEKPQEIIYYFSWFLNFNAKHTG